MAESPIGQTANGTIHQRPESEKDASVRRALDLLADMEREGSLEVAAEALAGLKLMRDALTDDMVIGLVRRVNTLLEVGTDPVVARYMVHLPEALREAHAEEQMSNPPGIRGLFRLMKDPDVQKTVSMCLRVAKKLGAEV